MFGGFYEISWHWSRYVSWQAAQPLSRTGRFAHRFPILLANDCYSPFAGLYYALASFSQGLQEQASG